MNISQCSRHASMRETISLWQPCLNFKAQRNILCRRSPLEPLSLLHSNAVRSSVSSGERSWQDNSLIHLTSRLFKTKLWWWHNTRQTIRRYSHTFQNRLPARFAGVLDFRLGNRRGKAGGPPEQYPQHPQPSTARASTIAACQAESRSGERKDARRLLTRHAAKAGHWRKPLWSMIRELLILDEPTSALDPHGSFRSPRATANRARRRQEHLLQLAPASREDGADLRSHRLSRSWEIAAPRSAGFVSSKKYGRIEVVLQRLAR